MKTKAAIVILTLLLASGCVYVARYDGTYRGKVVDADSREPIEGVVVLGTWYTETPTLAGAVSSYYDARETTTDKNGDFSIPGQGLRIMSRLLPMDVMIFKTGYQFIGPLGWDSLTLNDYYSARIKWEGDKPIFPLKKLTMEERKRQIVPSPPHEAKKEKIRLMVNEINKDSIECGFGTREIGR